MHTCKTQSLRMKNLFFVAVAMGIISGTSFTAKAQTSISLESLSNRNKPKISLHFIEGIEIKRSRVTDNLPADNVGAKNATSLVAVDVNNYTASTIEQCSAMQFKYAVIMNREVETLTNTTLYNFIDKWWATRYRYGGTDKYGIDCSAFTGKILSTIYGVALPRTAAEQYKTAEKIAKENLKEGDLVFFNTRGGVSHVGFYLGDNYFVHSSVAAGVTISSLKDDYYSRKFIAGGRVCR